MNRKLQKAIKTYFDSKKLNTIKDFKKDIASMNIKEKMLQQIQDEAYNLIEEKGKK